jgi:glucosyl-3-phosphoglycerate synthase
VVWCDGDVVSFSSDWVVRLVTPLLEDDGLALVKAMYHRPTTSGGGGRTTELVARPLLSMLAPQLAGLAQPLAGEYAARRSVLATIPFACGWGAEVAMLLDVAERRGVEAIGQVDLGERHHRHQPLADLSIQAAEVLATVLARTGRGPFDEELRLASGEIVELNLDERPPISELSPARGPR